jgi:hypothetical protein
MSVIFNPFTGNFDFTGSGGGGGSSVDNFSYKLVSSGVEVIIPIEQEMVLASGIDIDGQLEIEGSLEFVDSDNEQTSHWQKVPSGKVVYVPTDRVLFFTSGFDIDGELILDGAIEGVS